MSHKQHPGIESWWRVSLYRKHYVEIFVWTDKESMYAANDYNKALIREPLVEHNYIGAAIAGISAVRMSGKVRKIATPRKFGEIFFVTGNMSARIVAHEIQHIINYWVKGKYWDIGKMDERIATMAGDFHRNFWIEFYKRYKAQDNYDA